MTTVLANGAGVMLERRYLVARSRMDAMHTARGQGWQRTVTGWRDSRGNDVIYIDSVEELADQRQGRVIYLGFGHRDNDRLWDLPVVAQRLGFDLQEL
jgi:hypothetical protein